MRRLQNLDPLDVLMWAIVLSLSAMFIAGGYSALRWAFT